MRKHVHFVKNQNACTSLTIQQLYNYLYQINTVGYLSQNLVCQELYASTFQSSHIQNYFTLNLNCFKMFFNMIKTCLKRSFFGSSFIKSWDFWNETQMQNTSFDWFSMDLGLFLREAFRFVFTYKKRESPYSRKFLYNILNLV